ncbi:MAG: hypothetical protein GHCLOJNM_00263 [bacterium]|nr:hypothetical protein [bacterium]
MLATRPDGHEHPGLRWGPFTLRVPFYHVRIEWPEFWQGILVAGATGLGLVPILMRDMGLSFEAAVGFIVLQSMLISSAPILFGEPMAPGWITPALPLVLLHLLDPAGPYQEPSERVRAMTAFSLDFAALVLFLGVTGLGRIFIAWLPAALKGGIILGAAIAALKRVFLDDYARFLAVQPVATTLAVAVCLVLTFSAPIQKYKLQIPWLRKLAALGLLPGFLLAALIGPFVGNPPEIVYQIEWNPPLLIPPFGELFRQVSPLSIGWPSLDMFLAGIPLALMAYTILFGDLVTGIEVLKAAMPARPDEKVVIDINRAHLSIGIRNALMSVLAPFFPSQGCLWTGVHVIICQRWGEGRKEMDSLYGGIFSYYMFGIPFLYFIRPLVTGLKPLMGIALSLTLVLTGYACAYVAMSIPKTPNERGVVLLSAVALAVFSPWVGMLIGVLATLALVGFPKRPDREGDPA